MSTDWNTGNPSGLVALPNTNPERSLYLAGMGPTRRAGSKEPAIIIEHGLSATRYEWLEVQRQVARFARVYVYERAGYEPSSAADVDVWTSKGTADDLKALLDAAGVAPPYILVGHSLGGLPVRRCLVEWGKEVVAGLVIVDAAPIRTAVPKDLGTLCGETEFAKVIGMDRIFTIPEDEFERVRNDEPKNEKIVELEFETFDEELLKLHEEIGGRQLLGDGPLSVIFCDESVDCRKILEHSDREGTGSVETREELRNLLEYQAELDESRARMHLTLSSRARFVKAEGDNRTHNVHLVDPGFVTREIEWAWKTISE